MGGFLDPYHNPASTMFCAFIRMAGGRLRITKNTGHRSADDDLKRETPSVDSMSPKFSGLE